MDKVLGLDLLKKEKISVSKEILELVNEREKARQEKDWKKADILREKIKKKGYIVEDAPEGPKVKLIKQGF